MSGKELRHPRGARGPRRHLGPVPLPRHPLRLRHAHAESISSGRAEIVTDRIETFTEGGIELESGAEIDADLVVTATGLNLLFLGGMRVTVDGAEVDLSKAMTYKGMMLSDIPNFAFTLGIPTPPGR